MSYHIIDMASDPRCGQFAYFRQMDFPFTGVTAEIDITDFMAHRGQRPFFLSFLYAVTRAANAVPQLRRRIFEGGTVAEFDWCPPSYTAMKPDGVYVYCTVEGDLPYDDFIALGQRRQQEVLERGTLTEDGDARAFFFVSSLPWLHYSQLQHPAVNPDDSNPASAGASTLRQMAAPPFRCRCSSTTHWLTACTSPGSSGIWRRSWRRWPPNGANNKQKIYHKRSETL